MNISTTSVLTLMFLVVFYMSITQISDTNTGNMQREQAFTTLPQSSPSTRQHHTRVADPAVLLWLVALIGAYDPSRDYTSTSLCCCCCCCCCCCVTCALQSGCVQTQKKIGIFIYFGQMTNTCDDERDFVGSRPA